MTLDLLDILLVIHFCFEKQVPWWLWILGALASMGNQYNLAKLRE